MGCSDVNAICHDVGIFRLGVKCRYKKKYYAKVIRIYTVYFDWRNCTHGSGQYCWSSSRRYSILSLQDGDVIFTPCIFYIEQER